MIRLSSFRNQVSDSLRADSKKHGIAYFANLAGMTKGEWIANTELLPPKTLEDLETSLEGEDKQLFLQLMNKMLQWAPEDRKTAKELMKDPWIIKHASTCLST